MRTLRNPSTEFFDYTCPALDQIMAKLAKKLLQYVVDDDADSVMKAIDSATEAIKIEVTYPGRTAFDDVVNTLYEKDAMLDELQGLLASQSKGGAE